MLRFARLVSDLKSVLDIVGSHLSSGLHPVKWNKTQAQS